MPKSKGARAANPNEVQCPHCKLWSSLPIDLSAANTFAVKSLVDDFAAKLRGARANRIDEANAWVDLQCPQPHCAKTFRYNLRTGEVKP